MMTGETQGEVQQRSQLRGEGLGRGHPYLGAGLGEIDQLAGAHHRAVIHITNRQAGEYTLRIDVLKRR